MVPAIQPSQQAVHVPQLREDASGEGAGALSEDAAAAGCSVITLPQHFLCFLPLPQGQGSFLGVPTRA
jgi:hypothetical protein